MGQHMVPALRSGMTTYVFRVPTLVFSLSSEDFPPLRLLQPRAALRVLEVTRGRMVRSLKDLSPLHFSNSTTKGEMGFKFLIAGAGVFEFTLTDFGWRGFEIVATVSSRFFGDGQGEDLSGEAGLMFLCGYGEGREYVRERTR